MTKTVDLVIQQPEAADALSRQLTNNVLPVYKLWVLTCWNELETGTVLVLVSVVRVYNREQGRFVKWTQSEQMYQNDQPIFKHIHIYTHTCIYTHTYVCSMYVQLYIHTYVCSMYVYTYIHNV